MIKLAKKISDHNSVISSLSKLESSMNSAFDMVSNTLQRGGTVYFCGNGGSAADSQHLAAEFTGRFVKERQSLPGVALTVDTSAITAIANDYGFDEVFSRQLSGVATSGDLLIAISTSGNSKNVVNCCKVAKILGMQTIALTGATGGELIRMVDICLNVDSDITARIQEAHIFLGHLICEFVDGLEI